MTKLDFLKKPFFLSVILMFIIGGILIYLLIPKFFPKITIDLTERAEVLIEAKINAVAPDFTLKDLNDKDISLSNFKDDIVMITFWASWDPLSTDQLPILEEVYQKIKKFPELKILTINNGEPKTQTKSYIGRAEFNFPVLLDTNLKISETYKIVNLPTHFFIDKEGKIREIFVGPLDKNSVLEKINKLR